MARLTTIIFCLLILFLGPQVQAKNPPPGIGTNIPANVLIMLDVSGSMSATLSSASYIYYPLDSTTDSNGNIYILQANDTIKVFNSSGTYLRSIGGRGFGCNKWYYARQIEIYNNQIYVADYYGHSIKVIDLNGNCVKSKTLYSGSYCWSGGTYLCYPSGIAVGKSYIYISYHNWKSQISIHNTSNLSRVNIFTDSSRLYYNRALDLNSSENALVVSNYYCWSGRSPIVKYTVSGSSLTYSTTIGTCGWGSSNGYAYYPAGVAFDSNDNIYLVDYYTSRIQKFNSNGTYQAKTGTRTYGSAFYYPLGIDVDSSDNIYVSDYYNQAVRKFNTSLSEIESFGGVRTALSVAKKVIKKLVSDSNLTAGANFGFMSWGSWYKIRVNISSKGAKQIYNDIDNVKVCDAGCGTSLYNPMVQARNLFTSGKVSNWNLKCSNNYLLVISDGYWGASVNGIAYNMWKQQNIKTFAVGFNSGGFKTNYVNLAKNGGTTTPLYADNEKELFKKLTDTLKQITGGVSYNTLNTPAIIQKDSGDYIYQSTFEYKENEQWPGHLVKYKLNSSDGSIGNKLWDAADKLKNTKPASRNIWTAGLNVSGKNNFITTYRNELKPSLFPNSSPTDTEVDDLINFIRGVDTYDEDADNNKTEERHKLNDIYNSELMIVGSVNGTTDNDGSTNFQKKDAYYRSINKYDEFKNGTSCGGKCSERKEVVYAGSNGGMLHAFDASDDSTNGGKELWGYIPPNLLGKLSDIISSTANQTNSIYGVDGSMTVKDIYYDDTPTNNKDDPSWKTILLGGLGAGGHGYYALDITDHNSPKHLFAILNDTFNNKVMHWDSEEGLNEYGCGGSFGGQADWDYCELGEAWSTPKIIRIKHEGKDKWVAVFGGGFNGAVNPNYGSAVFVMDLENEGKLLKKIGIASTSNRLDTIVSSIPSDLTVITADGTDKANYSGAMVYAADLGGKITKINMTDTDSSGNITSSPTYSKTTLFSAESGTNNERYIYHEMEATINDDDTLWLYFGTGDMQKLETKPNTSNRIYGIKDKDFPNYKSISTAGTISQCKTAPRCPGSNDLGWYINLKNSQKLTASPTIDNDLIHYTVYEPTTSSNSCDKGNAIKCTAKDKCGHVGGSNKCTTLGKGVLSKVVVHKGKVYMGISGEAKNVAGFTSKDNLIKGDSGSTAKKAGGKIQLEGWRENY